MYSRPKQPGLQGAAAQAGAVLAALWGRLVFVRWGLLALVLLVGVQHGMAGQERYEYDPLGRLVRFIDTNNQVTEYTYDPAGNILSVSSGANASAYVPALSTIAPDFIRRGEAKTTTVQGQRLSSGTLQTSDPGLDISNLQQSPTQLRFTLSAALSAALGAQTLTFANAAGSANIGITVGPRLPVLSVEPTPLALPPDNVNHAVSLRLSNADLVAHQVLVTSSDNAKLSVGSPNVTFTPGQTVVPVNLTPKAGGFVNLVFSSATLNSVTVPVFVTTEFRGVNTSYAAPVGVIVGSATPTQAAITATTAFNSAPVGLAVGTVLSEVAPPAAAVGTAAALTIRGSGIPSSVSVAAVPGAGLTWGVPSVSPDGRQVTVSVQADASASPGPRRIVVTDGAGKALPFADISKSQWTLTSGQPTLDSISPLFSTPGTTIGLRLRGKHLQNGRLAITPSVDLRIDAQPQVNADGTELLAYVQIDPLAATGTRTVQALTPSGQTSEVPSVANQWTLVSAIKGEITPIVAPLVGLVVGSAQPASTQTYTPLTAPSVGLAVGAFATEVTPRAGVVGTSLTLQINGQGLQSVQSVGFVSSTGITTSAFSVNAQGTALTLPIAIDVNAPKTSRRLVLQTAAGPLAFIDPAQASFLVTAPVPQIQSVSPQVVQAGQVTAIDIRGVNLRDIVTVRFEPDQGLSPQPATLSTNAEGTRLSFTLQAAAGAPSGPRTVVVVAAGGESSTSPQPANMLYVAQQVGPTYAAIAAPLVGLQVGATSAEVTNTMGVYAPAVGLQVGTSVPSQDTSTMLVNAPQVGVVVGAAITGLSPAYPDGFLKGSVNQPLHFSGVGLEQVSSVSLAGSSTQVQLGAYSVNAQGTLLTVPVTVGDAAPAGPYRVNLHSGSGTATSRITVAKHEAYTFAIGSLPTALDSVSPIVLEQGKTYAFTVRGSGLQDVYQIVVDPADQGVVFEPPQWSTDALGEKLTARVRIASDAAIGNRVVRLRVPGAATEATPVPANTITIIAPL